ncbi:DUF411 domain-containing protein [Salinibius halmophilus]|uniref:DUF411 domain-containing protein n=1 Tax=Salinibius halmophilus TaxID=1853216 RepID=UPI000E667CB8|nr:DUF411 domain-containing protein [Salinibius halmophilus]
MKKLVIATLASTLGLSALAAEMTVHKSPYCGCCTGWVEIMEDKGHELTVIETENVNDIKVALGITPNLASCHTVEADDYFFEGHIPEAEIVRFLENPPAGAVGLTVPGMPMMSPGMAPEGETYRDFDVLLVREDGSTEVYASY